MRRLVELAFLPLLVVACVISVALGLGLFVLLPLELGEIAW